MDTENGILCPIPDNERTPFVDVLLKFIDWQKVCIENVERENDRLKKEIIKLKKKQVTVERKENRPENRPFTINSHKSVRTIPKRKELITPITKPPKLDPVKPEDIQQLLVKNTQQLLVNIGSRNKRQFTRLHIHLDADLDFGVQCYNRRAVENISLGGLYVSGKFHQRAGDLCTVSLNHSAVDAALEVHATCSVIRRSKRGMALEFLSMKVDDFCHLQTILLYGADDPLILGTEFVNNLNIELEGDLIICKSFHFHQENKNERE